MATENQARRMHHESLRSSQFPDDGHADVVEMMRKVKGVVSAEMTFGPYDAIAIVASDLNALGVSSCVRFGRCPAWIRSLAWQLIPRIDDSLRSCGYNLVVIWRKSRFVAVRSTCPIVFVQIVTKHEEDHMIE
jgi:hypothetical protein